MQESGYVTIKRQDQRPTTVPFAATPDGQPPTIKAWAKLSVWTERMLTTLKQGVEGGRWSSAMAQRLLSSPGALQLKRSPCGLLSILSQVKPLTGEPDAGNPPVRFGGRGGWNPNQPSLPLSRHKVCRAPRELGNEEHYLHSNHLTGKNKNSGSTWLGESGTNTLYRSRP